MSFTQIPLLPFSEEKILYSQFDFGGEKFLVFEPKVRFIKLFRGSVKLHSTRIFTSVLAGLITLNPSLSYLEFRKYADYIEENHFAHPFTETTKDNLTNWVWAKHQNNELTEIGKYRRIVFNPSIYIPIEEKRAIIGRYTRGNTISEEHIYEALESLQESNIPITYNAIAETLQCSEKTIKRNVTDALKEYKASLNEEITLKRDLDKFFDITEYIIKETSYPVNRSQLQRFSGLSGQRIKDICDTYNIL